MKMKHFNISEFDSPDLPGSGINMKKKFLEKLIKARRIADIPFIINSGYRTLSHNSQVRGTLNSAHVKGLATDIHCVNSNNRFIIISALLIAGFNRIGIYNTWIHVDCDESKPQNIIYWG
ncbi:MAG: D-Ala-D-Ala carboxypeptidase family metallohydrolase [Pseudomonadota bacterium]|nr:D-Ala-D-Ala carboxypeptidase family metallohydrolase [Pseudomonadota bacterium]